MTSVFTGYGLWIFAFVNAAIFIIFAFSFFKPQTARGGPEPARRGVFSGLPSDRPPQKRGETEEQQRAKAPDAGIADHVAPGGHGIDQGEQRPDHGGNGNKPEILVHRISPISARCRQGRSLAGFASIRNQSR